MNQNLLIVDDEYEILTWLEEMFRFNFDFEIGVYTANSALKALELLDQIKFDVVLTDIRMPGMDGITLFHKIKQNWPRCKTIFLTGYRNFDDMYQIVNHKDVRYILKSEADAVIRQTVKESLIEFREELERETLHKKQEEKLEKVNYWMCREFVNGFLTGELQSLNEQEIKRRSAEMKIPVSLADPFLVFLIRLDESREMQTGIYDSIGLLEDIEQTIQENMPGDIKIYMHTLEQRQAIILIQPENRENAEWDRIFTVAQGAVEYAQDIIAGNYQSGFSVVVTSTTVDCLELYETVARLKQVMVGYLGREAGVIAHEEALVSEKKETPGGMVLNKVPLLKSYLELQRRPEYFELLSDCGHELAESGSRHDVHAMELYYSISVLLLQFINENKMNEEIAFQIGLYKLTKVDEHASWMEASQYLFDISDAIFRMLGDSGNALSDRALKRVGDYIEENLAGDLSLTRLAKVGGFNASYLSRLFKQVYRATITDYIFEKRMNLAEKLLSATDCRIQDVAVRTGYLSSQSFTRAFRGYRGVTPQEYRELLKTSNDRSQM